MGCTASADARRSDVQRRENTVGEKRVDFSYNVLDQFTSIARYKDADGGSTHEVATSTFGYDTLGRRIYQPGLSYLRFQVIPNVSATARLTTSWPMMLTARAKGLSDWAAASMPRLAICSTHGSVTLHNA